MTRVLLVCVLGLLAALLPQPAGAYDILPFENQAQEQRFHELTRELRCLVCQNESLAESRAELAQDLRLEVLKLMQQGLSDAQIKTYLTDRYGDFVLYDPPLNKATWFLWFGPLLVLLVGAGVVVSIVRRRSRGLDATVGGPIDDGEGW